MLQRCLFCAGLQCFEPFTAVNSASAAAIPGLRITPNPTDGPCFIEVPEGGPFSEGQLSIFDNSGRMILFQTTRLRRLEISAAGWPQGVYYVLWKTRKEVFSGQIVKQ
ncbi:MAG: T9SS type A sorting domain-containing protein [Phaeodactylibacter sp.]|nr:T9SS type A sorting domain-containing protein [Phaeodactylibacter sp.]MCB9297975.1 T9SS type A sorting domain-containing protein [Lewinellaceae bacterium]